MSASSTSPFAVETIVDLLDGTADAEYTLTQSKPDRINPIWEYDHNDRVNYADPAFYVWSPTDADISKFSIDGDNLLEDTSVEVLIFTLDATKSKNYQRDVLEILSDYYDDTTDNTSYYEIAPQSASDLRNEHISGRTDHYITSVTVETNRFGQAGL
jgi:hypothetical protein